MKATDKVKHTPGPWKIDERIGCIAVYPESEKHHCLAIPLNNFIAYWHGYNKGDGWEISEKDLANAKLIAAAPMMLKEMEESLELLQKYDAALVGIQKGIPADSIRSKLNPVIHKLGQAIKKATS